VAPSANFVYKPGVNSVDHRPKKSEEMLLLAHFIELEPERWLRRMPGRVTLLTRLKSIENGARVVVKRFEGGAGREGWHERLFGRRVRSEARREFEILGDLGTVGIPVPRPIRCVENREASSLRPMGTRGRSVVVMECIEHIEDARKALGQLGSADRRNLLGEVLRIARKLHERGWIHRDLYLQHFLLPCASEGSLVLIDVGRARWSRNPGRRWLVKDLAALQLSAPANVTRSERLRFLFGWLRGQGVREQVGWKRWARQVIMKARRLGAHQPRFEDGEQVVGVQPERSVSGGAGTREASERLTLDHE